MIEIDGSHGEGGGQIIRTALALALVTGKSFTIRNIRANRRPPGLRPQHLAAVNAAATIGHAEVAGAAVGARSIRFVPGQVKPGDYVFSIGTAGSTTLVLQTVLPPLMIAGAPSQLTLQGGTHNIKAPPFDFLADAYLPLISRMGPRVEVNLDRYGFYPPGGGQFRASIEPVQKLQRLDLPRRADWMSQQAKALVVKLPASVAQRELRVIRENLGWSEEQCEVQVSQNAKSSGNVVILRFVGREVSEVITAIGQRGIRAEMVATEAAAEARRLIDSNAPIGEHLADQLLIPMALAGGGSFVTGSLTLHTTTNIDVIQKFLDIDINTRSLEGTRTEVVVGARNANTA